MSLICVQYVTVDSFHGPFCDWFLKLMHIKIVPTYGIINFYMAMVIYP